MGSAYCPGEGRSRIFPSLQRSLLLCNSAVVFADLFTLKKNLRGGEMDRERELSTGSFSKYLLSSGLRLAEAASQELNPDLTGE